MGEIYGIACPFYQPGDPGTEYEMTADRWRAYGDESLVERFAPTAFDRTLQRRDVRCDLFHNNEVRVGYTSEGSVKLSVDRVGLRYVIDLSRCQSPYQIRELLALRSLRGASVSFYSRSSRQFVENGRRILEHLVIDLDSFALVRHPAYLATTVEIRGGRPFEMIEGEQI
ncbi:Marine sediment metagenome DNA, contig: S01H1_L03343 (Fragment) OS=marine sediment metagenome GN=S01H1_10112 PE=4 SV=1: Peptidase_U35 [Gemmata massiliana]|uniref:Prohead serine protease domain-containing protein n=1 Tax=Gemmata massiliana TaxID=1210884 RepID=A0A6P2CVX3_9BACT